MDVQSSLKSNTVLGFSVLSFLAGIYFCLTYHDNGSVQSMIRQPEGATTMTATGATSSSSSGNPECPSLLVKKDGVYLLYFKDKPTKDGENPLPLYSLDEYKKFVEVQRQKGLDCPVLFLQYETDLQGNDVYRVRPSPTNLSGGLPTDLPPGYMNDVLGKGKPIRILDASRAGGFNANMFPGFDPYGQHQGEWTEVDEKQAAKSKAPISDDPMDPNWGGTDYSEEQIRSGKYADRYVTKPRMVNLPISGSIPPQLMPARGPPPPPNEVPAELLPEKVEKINPKTDPDSRERSQMNFVPYQPPSANDRGFAPV